ncbi:MAG: dienelactone hydrolase family protein [Candidatus Dormiibacterota bacterium]
MEDALTADSLRIKGHGGDQIDAYLATPHGDGTFGGVVVIHHAPGFDRWSKEVTRTFAANGYLAICPNLHFREGKGASPEDAAAAVRAAGGVPDERLVGDVDAAARHLRALPASNGRVGVIGYCSGGRQSFLAACSLQLDAAVVCYGAFIVGAPPAEYASGVTPILDRAPNLSCPVLGLFGVEDRFPSPDQVRELDAELTRLGKPHEFHSYEGAGHAFFAVDRPSYRVEAAKDGWERIWEFFGRHLAG